jgi:caffeoyl-CoA O-methyltransferase
LEKSFAAPNDPKLIQYLESTFGTEDETLLTIRRLAKENDLPDIHVGPFDGKILTVLTKAFQAKKIVEIGTLAGYSGVCLIRGAGPSAKLWTFEMDPSHIQVAKRTFQLAGIESQVEIHQGPALENLPKIESHGPFDLVFIDANKTDYPAYLNWAYDNLKKGGVALGDNTLAWGKIADMPEPKDRQTNMILALQKFNLDAGQSSKWTSIMLPTGEGLTIAVKN